MGKGVHMYKGVCVCGGGGVTLLILSHFSKISHENKIILVSLRPNYFIFIGYFKMWGRGMDGV